MYSENNSHEDILIRMKNNVSNDIDKNEGSMIYDALSPASIEFESAYKSLDDVANKFDIENLTDDELEQRINQRIGITRNPATYATGSLDITGTGTINQGALFQTSGGIQFQSTETKTITASGTINIQAVVAGASGMVPANQITVIPVAIAGITAVTNSSPTINGYDAESDSALIERYYEMIQTPATSGNKAQFKSWAKEVSGVGDAKVFPLWNGNNTVKIIIVDANKQPPSTELVNQVQEYIDPNISGIGEGIAPIGCFCTIDGAVGKTIDIRFTVIKDSNYTDQQRLESIQVNLAAYFKSIAFISNFVSYAQIGALILQSDGILDYSSLTVNNDTRNVSLADTEVPILGGITID